MLVEDQEELAENIIVYLKREGILCEHANSLSAATEKLYGYSYDILTLDLMLPDGNGLELLEKVKDKWPEMGVLIISAKNDLNDRVIGLNFGADDYLPKPFHLVELNARLKAIYRRKNQQGEHNLFLGEIKLQMDSKEAIVNDELLDLTPKEFDLLHYFAVNKNRLLTKQAIAEHLWGDYMDMVDSFDFVYQHIKNLRRKITAANGADPIITVYGTGYKVKS